jgi:hypothetical protein
MRANRLQITLLNHASKLFPDAQLVRVMQACQRQMQDFGRAWGWDAVIGLTRAGSRQPANLRAAWIVLLENEEQGKALGIADLTPAGLPLEAILVGAILDEKGSVSRAVSQAILSIVANPAGNDFSRDPQGEFVAHEVSDPVAGDLHGYKLGGILLSDFVYPAWFSAGAAGPYDHMRRCKEPFQVLEGAALPTEAHTLRSSVQHALHGGLTKSDPKSAGSIALPGGPARQPVRRPPPPPRVIAAPVVRPVLRQPNRGASTGPAKDKTVLRQPLRGFRAEASAPTSPAPASTPVAQNAGSPPLSASAPAVKAPAAPATPSK